MKNLEIVGLLTVFIWMAVIALFPGIGLAGIKAIDPVHGPAKIKGEDISYYHCKIKLAADLSVSQQAPINMKTLALELEGIGAPGAVRWNASMVAGPNGALEFKIPKGGYVVLNFLWEVPKGFTPGRIQIGDIHDVSLKK